MIAELASVDNVPWYAVWTRSNREKTAAAALGAMEVPHFLPLVTSKRQWSDRVKVISKPLFSGYVFVRFVLTGELQFRILNIPGIAGFVGNSQGPAPIPTREIEAIREVLARDSSCTPCPFLRVGDRVRVTRGPLAGIEGAFVRSGTQSKLVISVEMIQRSVSVNISAFDVETLSVAKERGFQISA